MASEEQIREWQRLACDWSVAEGHIRNALDAATDVLLDRDAEIARLRAVLEWMTKPTGRFSCDRLKHAHNTIEDMGDAASAAIRGDWPAVRAAGVVLPGEEG